MPVSSWPKSRLHLLRAVACSTALLCISATARADDDEMQAAKDPRVPTTELLTPNEQRDKYLWSTFGPPGFIGAALSSGFQQARDVPQQWGQTKTAYVERFAAEYAESTIDSTTRFVVARMLNEDPSFRRCRCKGAGHRLRHATLGPFTSVKPDGRSVFSLARTAGLTAGETVANVWSPSSAPGAKNIVEHVAVDLASKMAVDVLREFVLHKRDGS